MVIRWPLYQSSFWTNPGEILMLSLFFFLLILPGPSAPCRPTFNPDFNDATCTAPPAAVPADTTACPADATTTPMAIVTFPANSPPTFTGCTEYGMTDATGACGPIAAADLAAAACSADGKLMVAGQEVASIYCVATTCTECATAPPAPPAGTCTDVGTETPTMMSTNCVLSVTGCTGTIGVYANGACASVATAAELTCVGGMVQYMGNNVEYLYCSTTPCTACTPPAIVMAPTCPTMAGETPVPSSDPATCAPMVTGCTNLGILQGATCTSPVTNADLTCTGGAVQYMGANIDGVYCAAPCTECPPPTIVTAPTCPTMAGETPMPSSDPATCAPMVTGCTNLGILQGATCTFPITNADLTCTGTAVQYMGANIDGVFCAGCAECTQPTPPAAGTCNVHATETVTMTSDPATCAVTFAGCTTWGVYDGTTCTSPVTVTDLTCVNGDIQYMGAAVTNVYCAAACTECTLPPPPAAATCTNIHATEMPMIMTTDPATCAAGITGCTTLAIYDGTTCISPVTAADLTCVNGNIQYMGATVPNVYCAAACMPCTLPPTTPTNPTTCTTMPGTPMMTAGTDCAVTFSGCTTYGITANNACVDNVDTTAVMCTGGALQYMGNTVESIFCQS